MLMSPRYFMNAVQSDVVVATVDSKRPTILAMMEIRAYESIGFSMIKQYTWCLRANVNFQRDIPVKLIVDITKFRKWVMSCARIPFTIDV